MSDSNEIKLLVENTGDNKEKEFKSVEIDDVDENDASIPYQINSIPIDDNDGGYINGGKAFDGSKILLKIQNKLNNDRISVETINAVCEYLARGFSIGGSCTLSHVKYRTFHNWLLWGKKEYDKENKLSKNALYLYAYMAFETAIQQFKEWHLRIIDSEAFKGENKGTKSSQWRLARRFPKEFGEKMQVQLEANKKLDEIVKSMRGIDEKVKEEIGARPIKEIEEEEKNPYLYGLKKDNPELYAKKIKEKEEEKEKNLNSFSIENEIVEEPEIRDRYEID